MLQNYFSRNPSIKGSFFRQSFKLFDLVKLFFLSGSREFCKRERSCMAFLARAARRLLCRARCNWKKNCTRFAFYYEKIRHRLLKTATNSAKIHSLARNTNIWLRINQIQLRCLHFNQHSITLLGIHMRHSTYKREKYTFINANIKVINTILKVKRDNRKTLKYKHYSLIFL